MASIPSLVIPGQLIASTATHNAGAGTHVFDSMIRASIFGSTAITPGQPNIRKPVISVPQAGGAQLDLKHGASSNLPVVGSNVLCRIIRVQQRQAIASILLVDPSNSSSISSTRLHSASTNEDLQFQAILRKEDIRAYDKDKIVLNDMCRLGDIVRATVISLGDERSYYISTAGNEYGVVVATSEDGNAMVPASWKEMKDVVTGKGELRKVAKPL